MVDDVILNKAASIDRCLERVLQEYEGHQAALRTDFTRQDAIVLNLLRACEAAIDLAMHITRVQSLGVPQSSRDAFDMLASAGYIEAGLADRLKRMVGFRNIAIHNYREISLDIVEKIITERLDDFRDYTRALVSQSSR